MMTEIISRVAQSHFDALMIAQGMEDAGCNVFSVIYVAEPGNTFPTFPWSVWGRFDSLKTDANRIDACINGRLFPQDEELQS